MPISILMLIGSSVLAQTQVEPMEIQPIEVQRVDQAVGDLDPLGRSMRQQGAGLRVDGEHTSLFAISKENLQKYQVFGQAGLSTGIQRTNVFLRIAPGITAQMDQTTYLVPHATNSTGVASNVASSKDGAFVEAIPANTIFILSPQLSQAVQQANVNPYRQSNVIPSNRVMPKRVDNRINRQINGRVASNRYELQRVDNRVSTSPHQSQRYRVHALKQNSNKAITSKANRDH